MLDPIDFLTPTFCFDCGRQSHHYQMEADLEYAVFDADGVIELPTPAYWVKVEGKHKRGCPSA